MGPYQVNAGATDVSVVVRIVDSADGSPELSVTSATLGLSLQYRREGAGNVALTESDLAALTDAHVDGAMFPIGNGEYRVDIPDAAFAVGASGVQIHGTATGMVVFGPYIRLAPPTLLDGTFSGTHSVTSGDLGTQAPANDIIGMTMYFPAVRQSRVIETYNTGTGVAGWTSALASAPNNGDAWVVYPTAPIDDVTLAAIQAELEENGSSLLDTINDKLIGTIAAGTHNAQSGDAFARLGAPAGASVSADIAAIEAQTDDIGVAGAGLTAVPWNVAWDAEVESEVADALAVYDPPTTAEMNARTLVAANYATAANLAIVDTVVDAIQVVTDALGSTAAARMALSALGIVGGAAEAGTLSTTQMTTDLPEATDDHYNGRTVVWTSGPLAGQGRTITDYLGLTGQIDFAATTEPPQVGNTFVIV